MKKLAAKRIANEHVATLILNQLNESPESIVDLAQKSGGSAADGIKVRIELETLAHKLKQNAHPETKTRKTKTVE